MAVAGIKFDDGTGAYVNNCFPVRTIIKYGEPGEGAWLEAHRAEQRKRFKAVICSNPPRTYSRLRHERIVSERQDDEFPEPLEEPAVGLDGFFLLKHSCVDDPADLCSINIAAKNIAHAQPDDFQLFDNVAYINAADNRLTLEIFNNFPILRELELPLNSLESVKLSCTMFRHLEMLDLSYNSLSANDLLQVGFLRNLKVLYFSGNGLESLPENMAGFYLTETGYKKRRFPKLEILCLDDNKLNNFTAFAPLAGLKELKHLNLESNDISSVPRLEPKTIRHDNLDDSQNQLEEDENEAAEATDATNAAETEEEAELNKLTAKPKTVEFTFSDLQVSGPTDQPQQPSRIEEEVVEGAVKEMVVDGMVERTEEDNQIPENEEEESESEDEQDGDDLPAIPFPQLRFLSLAHNYLTEEEDLLSLAAWPNVAQVHIYDNPLTNNRAGEPPMLKKFLTERLGIELVRKQPQVMKPVKEFPPLRKGRQVTTNIPPVPKCDVERLLMIEAAKRDELPSTVKSPILPPITTSTTAQEETPEEELETEHLDEEQADTEPHEKPIHVTPADVEQEGNGLEAFMTEVDMNMDSAGLGRAHITEPSDNQEIYREKKTPHKVLRISADQERMFRGYEELLIEDEFEKNIKIPSDVHASVKALQYALKHPVVDNNKLRLDTSQKPFLPYKRSDVQSRKRPVTKAEKISRAMESVRRMNTVIEAPLERALTDKELHKNYPDAAKLLKDIQRKFAQIQSNTTVDAKSVANMVKHSLPPRPHTDRVYLVDKDTSMTEIHNQKPPSHL